MKVHGWTTVDTLPPTDNEGESGYMLVMCKECSAPVVAWYNSFDRAWYSGIKSLFDTLTVQWWKPLDRIPVSILPPDNLFRRELAINMGLAWPDEKETSDETHL